MELDIHQKRKVNAKLSDTVSPVNFWPGHACRQMRRVHLLIQSQITYYKKGGPQCWRGPNQVNPFLQLYMCGAPLARCAIGETHMFFPYKIGENLKIERHLSDWRATIYCTLTQRLHPNDYFPSYLIQCRTCPDCDSQYKLQHIESLRT